jgi:hypothetical protein
MMRVMLLFCVFLAFGAQAVPPAELRKAELTRASLDELTRRCEINGKNEGRPLVLLTGQILQTRFEDNPKPACKLAQPDKCVRHHWFPKRFTGIFIKTNHYPLATKVAFHGEGLDDKYMQGLNFVVGNAYAVCVAPRDFSKGLPHFDVMNFDWLYQLVAPAK